MIRSALNLVVVVAMLALFCASSQVAHARDGDWIEVIETYEIPFDPDWRESALKAAGFFRFGSPDDFHEETGSVDRAEEYAERLRQAGKNERSQKAVLASWQKEVESFGSSAGAARKLFVVRVWDGIQRGSRTLVLGEKQRASFARCKPGAVLNVTLGRSNVPDHLQARGRLTITSVIGGSKHPSDFLFAKDGASQLSEVAFGEIDTARLGGGIHVGTADKDAAAGSGWILVDFNLPREVPIDSKAPWYCEFKLVELDKDGTPVKEVHFDGTKYAVAISGSRAKALVEVKNPKPFGYVAEAAAWFGVAPKAALKPAKQVVSPTAPQTNPPAPTNSPSKPSAPGRTPAAPSLPGAPITPPASVPK